MISLRKSATELERLEELHRAAVKCYSEALHTTEQNTIELDGSQAAHFRSQLQALRDQLRTDATRPELEAVQTSFDTELKDYHDKAQEQIQQLRQDVKAAAAAVESFAGSISESEVNLESGIQRELGALNRSAASNDIEVVREAIQASTAKIATSIHDMRASNQLVIAQLKDEIRLLHQEVQASRRPQPPADPSSESHQRMSGRMQELVNKRMPFSVLMVVVHNLEGLQNCYSPALIENALGGFQSRFENMLPSSAQVGRWTRNQFAAILSTAPSSAIELSSEVVRKLSEPCLGKEKGATQSLAFSPRAGVVEFIPGSDLAKFQTRLQQLAGALSA
jgi:GGDEF domain-containing protein